MAFSELNRGDQGSEVAVLQTLLNKVGAMLIADGDFGSATERGVRYAQDIAQFDSTGTADVALWQWLEAQSDPFPVLSSNGVAYIALEETGGLRYYQQVSRWPHFPGFASGITIGVGYDLRFNTEENFRELWQAHLPVDTLEILAQDIGKKGSLKRAKALQRMAIEVPFKAAWPVFVQKTLPRYYADTESIYPSLAMLPPLCQTVLVSLVFNRGHSLAGSRRSEMRAIRDILAEAASLAFNKPKRKMILADVEDEIVSMQRLWGLGSGLAKRRQTEANLWRQGLKSW